MSLNDLKTEIINQKQAIEGKFGTVTVANNNPSPSEITAGINTIPAINTSLATATESDVLVGKTFYSSSTTLKTGTATDLSSELMKVYFFSDKSRDFTTRITYNTPASVTRVRSYLFNECYNPIDVYFTDNITSIGSYSFSDTPEFRFYNFNSNAHITEIGEGAFYRASHNGIDFTHLPTGLTTIGDRGFSETLSNSDNLVIPNSVASCGNYAFAYTNARVNVGNLTMTTTLDGELPIGMFMGLNFNCDFSVPSGVIKINSNFNYKGCFNNITIPSSVTELKDYCFGAPLNDSVSNYHLNSVTFLGTTPPTLGLNVIALQNRENPNFKIFVPDESIDAYKANTRINSTYLNYVYPMSQHP